MESLIKRLVEFTGKDESTVREQVEYCGKGRELAQSMRIKVAVSKEVVDMTSYDEAEVVFSMNQQEQADYEESNEVSLGQCFSESVDEGNIRTTTEYRYAYPTFAE